MSGAKQHKNNSTVVLTPERKLFLVGLRHRLEEQLIGEFGLSNADFSFLFNISRSLVGKDIKKIKNKQND